MELAAVLQNLLGTTAGANFMSATTETRLPEADEAKFQAWKQLMAPQDSGFDYDFRGAYLAGVGPDEHGHWPDTFKKPTHPTFSTDSQYAVPGVAGKWQGEQFTPSMIQSLLGPVLQGQAAPIEMLRGY
jgi:hypothetical protein